MQLAARDGRPTISFFKTAGRASVPVCIFIAIVAVHVMMILWLKKRSA